MTLRQTIRSEIEAKRLQKEWTTADLLTNQVLAEQFAITTLNTSAPNNSTFLTDASLGMGHVVAGGNAPLFYRVGRRDGGALVYALPEHCGRTEAPAPRIVADTQFVEEEGGSDAMDIETPIDNRPTDEDIGTSFVEYLRNKPYRLMKNVKGGFQWIPQDGPVTGWNNRLNAYEWNGATWSNTKNELQSFVKKLAALEIQCQLSEPVSDRRSLETEAKLIYDDIRKWGNPKGKPRTGEEVLNHLQHLWNDTIVAVDSTLTKLYAFARPQTYVIYDSRVAAAMLTIAEDLFRMRGTPRYDTIASFQDVFRHLGAYGGSGGTRNRGYRAKWPHAYTNVSAQHDANRLCQCMVDVLNHAREDGREDWNLREVEAVLFMEGY